MKHRVCARLLVLCVTSILAAGAAAAGPWPREVGGIFLSTTSTLPAAGDWRPLQTETYAEFGLRRRVTLGGSFTITTQLDQANVFARWHPPDLPGGLVWGVSAGVRYEPWRAVTYRLMTGIDLGRGFDTSRGNLWMRGGVRLYQGTGYFGRELDTDLSSQIGWRGDRWLAMLGVTHATTRYGRYTRLRPAVGVRLGRMMLVAEGVVPPGERIEAVRLSVWSNF